MSAISRRVSASFPKRAIHLDFHTMPGIYDVGSDFDAEEFSGTLSEAGVDYINVFATCNLGFAYYPTKIGVPHPGLKKKDMLGPMVSACHKRGIRVAAYLNAGIDHEHARRHRDWVKVTKEGKVYDYQKMGHHFRDMCLNTDYRNYLLSMIREILVKYPVDGLFLDCFSLDPCYGVECLEGLKKRGMNVHAEDDVEAFYRQTIFDFMDEVKDTVRQLRKGIYIYFNGLPYRRQPTHIELEILPTGGWGYDHLPFCIRYARTLGKPFYTMTGRFHKSWGDFGGLRPKHALMFDCYNSIANGGACSIGDHMHPRGRFTKPVYKLVGEIYRAVKELEPWTAGAKNLADIAVVYPPLRDFPPKPHPKSGYAAQTIKGAARLLMELKCQFDVTDGLTDLSKYRVVILPDTVAVDSKLAVILHNFLAHNGILISSGCSGLNPEKSGFALPEYGLDYIGPSPNNIEYFAASKPVAADIPDMPITIYSSGIAMRARRGTEILAGIIQPYFNLKSWDLFHENLYVPPEKDSGRPALTRRGNVLHFAFPIFAGYFDHAVPAYKTLLGNCLARLFPSPLVKTQGLPSFGQVTVAAQGRKTRIVHLLTYLPELRGGAMQIIEEPIEIANVAVALRTDNLAFRKVYLAPSREELSFHIKDGYAHVLVSKINGYQMIVFE